MNQNMQEKFNDMAVMIKFFNENILLNNLMRDNEYISSNLNFALPLKNTYKTNYFCISSFSRKTKIGSGILRGYTSVLMVAKDLIFFPIGLPGTVNYFISAYSKSEYEFYVLDLSQEKYVFGYKTANNYKNFNAIENSVIYDSYWLINN